MAGPKWFPHSTRPDSWESHKEQLRTRRRNLMCNICPSPPKKVKKRPSGCCCFCFPVRFKMLGIRGNPLSRNNSGVPSVGPWENGNGSANKKNGEMSLNDIQVPTSVPQINGHKNLEHGPAITYSQAEQITVLRETVTSASGKIIRVLSGTSEKDIEQMNVEKFLEYIERQRLTAMPHRGCHWDRVLKWAEFFALQISSYANAIESFVPSSHRAAQLMLTCCHSLIELGQNNADPLSKTFGIFYELGLSLSIVLRNGNLLHANANIRHEVGLAFNDLLIIIRDVSLYYHSTVDSLSSGHASLDFAGLFRDRIEAYLHRKERIVNAIWSFELGEDASMQIHELREWLKPHDTSLRKLHSQRILSTDHRSEFTCEWLQRHLLDFSRSSNDTWAIHGPAGSGKTYLYRWLVERLERPIGKKSYDVLSYALEADVPTEATPLAVAKNLCLQLLEKNVGDKNMFDALNVAYDKAELVNDANLEIALWNALGSGLEQASKKGEIMVVIDGIDEISGGEQAAKDIVNHLGVLASRDWIQVITLSRNSHLKPKKGKTNSFEIKPEHTHEDLRHMTHQALHRYAHFKDQGEHAQEAIVEQIIHAAEGNFLWAFLTSNLLKEETSHESFMKAVKTTRESPRNLGATISKIMESVDLSQREYNILLSSMLVAERPLSITEVKLILQIDVQKTRFVDTNTDVHEIVTHALGNIIRVQNGFFRFRHPTIRAYIMSLANGQKLRTIPIIQAEYTLRLLAFCKLTIAQSREPSFELVEKTYVSDLFTKHALLEYAVRYWTAHFGASSFKPKADILQLGNDFKTAFPDSIVLILLEWFCWGSNKRSHELALKIRQAVLGDKHVCVIQDLIVCGSIERDTTVKSPVSSFFYRAWHLAQTVLHKHNSVTLACATKFLSITEFYSFTSRTDLVSHREELLKYTIEMYKHQYGRSHDLVIRYYKLLAQLYIDIHEEHHAEIIWRELQEIIVTRFGKGSEEETTISEKLTIILKKGEKKTDVVEYEKGIFDIVADLEIWNIRRIELTLELALSYESRKEFFKAEELYIELWRRLTERCHHHGHHHGVEIYIRTVEVVLEYARFLIRCKRHEEASGVLICLWTEYEDYDFESEILFLRLRTIGELMRSTSLLTIALSVFRKCCSWFQARGKVQYVQECEVLITTTVKEVVSVTSTTTVTSKTTTTITVIKEIFESSITRTEVTSDTIAVFRSLISLYIKLEQWSEALEVTRRSLLAVWKFVVTGGGTTALPRNFGSDAIEIAFSLAICYLRTEQFHEAEEIYRRIYRACWNSCGVEDERFLKVHTTVIKFYQDHRHWHSLIKVQQALLLAYREKLGAHHKLTIQILYTLGGLCIEHGHGNPYEYYEEIITVLNSATTTCHEDSFDAMLVLCRHYYEAGHWHKLKHTCKSLWETWKGQHHGYKKITAEFAAVLYLRYRYILEHHEHCAYSDLLQLTLEYRNTCIKVFGALTEISIKASIELAHIYMKSEKHIHEAITIYEEILTITKTTSTTTTTTTTTVISTSTLTTITERLTSAYIKVCSHESVSTKITERAIIVIRERFESLKITLGWAHTEVLELLWELVVLQLKLKKTESTVVILRLLSEACINIMKTEQRSNKLHEAAKKIGGLYVKCGMIDQAQTMIDDLRMQIIVGSSSLKDKVDFKPGSIGKTSYVFLVTFETVIKVSASLGYSELMADILTEAYLYESYHRVVKSQSDTAVILLHAAKLRTFLVAHRRHSQRDVLQNQAFDLFLRKWGQQIKESREIKFLFFVDLMDEFGKDDRNVQIGHAASASSIHTVRRLLGEGKILEAFEAAHCALDFINIHRAYHQLQTIPYGFKLSSLMVGRDLKHPLPAKLDPTLRKKMVDLSRKIIQEVLQACKESNINFIRMKPRELNDLSGLLGRQENFTQLEWLLDLLWSSRDVQKSWKPPIIIAIGRLFVQARFLNSKHDKAIRLAEDIVYNLRRVWGSLDPKTLQMEELLSALYTNMGHYREAMGVHENILRLIAEGDDGDDRTLDTANPDVVRRHILLLKQAHIRLRGWDKDSHVYRDLVHSVLNLPQYKGRSELKGTDLHVEHWNLKEAADDKLGKFSEPSNWEFAHEDDLDSKGEVKNEGYGAKKRPGLGMKRVTSHWGMSEVRKVLFGDFAIFDDKDQKGQKQAYTNGHSYTEAVAANGHGDMNEKAAMVAANAVEDAGYHTPEEEL